MIPGSPKFRILGFQGSGYLVQRFTKLAGGLTRTVTLNSPVRQAVTLNSPVRQAVTLNSPTRKVITLYSPVH